MLLKGVQREPRAPQDSPGGLHPRLLQPGCRAAPAASPLPSGHGGGSAPSGRGRRGHGPAGRGTRVPWLAGSGPAPARLEMPPPFGFIANRAAALGAMPGKGGSGVAQRLKQPDRNSSPQCWGSPIHQGAARGASAPHPPERAQAGAAPSHLSVPAGSSTLLPPRSPCAGSGRASTSPGPSRSPSKERPEGCSPTPRGCSPAPVSRQQQLLAPLLPRPRLAPRRGLLSPPGTPPQKLTRSCAPAPGTEHRGGVPAQHRTRPADPPPIPRGSHAPGCTPWLRGAPRAPPARGPTRARRSSAAPPRAGGRGRPAGSAGSAPAQAAQRYRQRYRYRHRRVPPPPPAMCGRRARKFSSSRPARPCPRSLRGPATGPPERGRTLTSRGPGAEIQGCQPLLALGTRRGSDSGAGASGAVADKAISQQRFPAKRRHT